MKKLLMLAVLAGAIYGIVELVKKQKAEWTGLTEPELRDKLHTKLATRMPEKKISEIEEKIIEEMRSRGMLAEEPVGAGPSGNGPVAGGT